MRLDMKNPSVASHYQMWCLGGFTSYEIMLESLVKELANKLREQENNFGIV